MWHGIVDEKRGGVFEVWCRWRRTGREFLEVFVLDSYLWTSYLQFLTLLVESVVALKWWLSDQGVVCVVSFTSTNKDKSKRVLIHNEIYFCRLSVGRWTCRGQRVVRVSL